MFKKLAVFSMFLALVISSACVKVSDPDPDKDLVRGSNDRCPNEPGPPDNFGCPPIDTDKDGIPDNLDQCPTLAGRYSGCPRVFASQNKILLMEKIFFATDQTTILPESYSVLEEVANLINLHPEWQEISVEAHTSANQGDPTANLQLSQNRALSVKNYLIRQEVVSSRLRYEGFGSAKPIADNATEEGRFLNRRIEFTISRFAPGATMPPKQGKK